MFKYVVLIACSKLGQDKKSVSSNKLRNAIEISVNESLLIQPGTSNTVINKNSQAGPHQSRLSESPEPLVLSPEPAYINEILNFVDLMRTKYLNTKTLNILEISPEDIDKRIIFDNLFIIWQNEQYEVSNIRMKKFSDRNLKKYRKYCKIINMYSNNFKKINRVFLFIIKKIVEASSISEMVKNAIIENIDLISSTMSYFEKFKPGKLRHDLNFDSLNLKYKLSLKRFPYLFDYFNFVEKFIVLYELIIDHHILVFHNQCIMNRVVYDMSINLTYVFEKRQVFLEATQNILTLFQSLEIAD
ncbi:uncharacterized protein VNE69_08167 [Vairimorpha necatrix]|uniref:Uncharacterized protein n=1 Tax=Vairimorpha necatrix TaxID=6039 RepID=A0AAX4JEZ0_9MICR